MRSLIFSFFLLAITFDTTAMNSGSSLPIPSIIQANDKYSAAEIAHVVNRAFTRAIWRREGANRTSEQEVQNMMSNPHKKLYLCLIDEKVCGTVLLDTSSSDAVVSLLAVLPEYRGHGIGEFLMQYVEQEIKKMNKDSVYIRVVPVGQERLVAYYERQGFRFVDTIEKKLFDHPDLVKEEYWGKLFLHTMRKSL